MTDRIEALIGRRLVVGGVNECGDLMKIVVRSETSEDAVSRFDTDNLSDLAVVRVLEVLK